MRILLACLLLLPLACSKSDYVYSDTGRTHTSGYSMPELPAETDISSWKKEPTAICVKAALAGQTNYPQLETAAQKYCGCVYDVVDKKYSQAIYYAYGSWLLKTLKDTGELEHCD